MAFGTDIDIDGDAVDGDIPSMGGVDLLRKAVQRVCSTRAGDLLHRPGFGASPELEEKPTPTALTAAATSMTRALLADDRVSEARVAVGARAPGVLEVDVVVRAVGFPDVEFIRFWLR